MKSTVLAHFRTFFRDIHHPDDIGIMDLYAPEPRRLKRFLCSMINAWRFWNDRLHECDDVVSEVKKKAQLASLMPHVIKYLFIRCWGWSMRWTRPVQRSWGCRTCSTGSRSLGQTTSRSRQVPIWKR